MHDENLSFERLKPNLDKKRKKTDLSLIYHTLPPPPHPYQVNNLPGVRWHLLSVMDMTGANRGRDKVCIRFHYFSYVQTAASHQRLLITDVSQSMISRKYRDDPIGTPRRVHGDVALTIELVDFIASIRANHWLRTPVVRELRVNSRNLSLNLRLNLKIANFCVRLYGTNQRPNRRLLSLDLICKFRKTVWTQLILSLFEGRFFFSFKVIHRCLSNCWVIYTHQNILKGKFSSDTEFKIIFKPLGNCMIFPIILWFCNNHILIKAKQQ